MNGFQRSLAAEYDLLQHLPPKRAGRFQGNTRIPIRPAKGGQAATSGQLEVGMSDHDESHCQRHPTASNRERRVIQRNAR